ncbi:Urease accessory protein UreD [Tritonibacter multivorans]|uniref:Urease accessory protein UreD n=1 Tax=Tritonibacter multivorans TaxID=928856 RepID=A0A0P1G7S8_9RHOB|nr:Urease accessory protein UreD [Tritonibacter multivorans]SFD12961.1 urease accessory protein [Tritonibacter multivorans]
MPDFGLERVPSAPIRSIKSDRTEQTQERRINTLADIIPATAKQPRAVGTARVSSKYDDGRVGIDQLHQSGAMKLLFPRGRAGVEAVMVNTAGGITGGDRFDISATAGMDSLLTITTQAAERAYRAQPGETGHVVTDLTVADNARLNWLPQETILFQNSAFRRHLNVDLAPHGRFLMVEPLVFGRAAMGEEVTQARFQDHVEIRRDGTRIYKDAIHLTGDLTTQLARPAVGGALAAPTGAMASLIFAAPEAEGALDWIRSQFEATDFVYGGASLLAPDLLICRVLAEESFSLRKALLPILDRLTNNGLPRCWRL